MIQYTIIRERKETRKGVKSSSAPRKILHLSLPEHLKITWLFLCDCTQTSLAKSHASMWLIDPVSFAYSKSLGEGQVFCSRGWSSSCYTSFYFDATFSHWQGWTSRERRGKCRKQIFLATESFSGLTVAVLKASRESMEKLGPVATAEAKVTEVISRTTRAYLSTSPVTQLFSQWCNPLTPIPMYMLSTTFHQLFFTNLLPSCSWK